MNFDGTTLYGTTGEGVGFANATFLDPKSGITITVLTSVFSEDFEATVSEVLKALPQH